MRVEADGSGVFVFVEDILSHVDQQQQQNPHPQQHPQPQLHPQQSRIGVASFIEPPPKYEDVMPRIEDVTDYDDDDGDVIEISDAEEEVEEEERKVVNSGYEAEVED